MFYEHLADASGTALMRLRFALINIFLKFGHFWSPLYIRWPFFSINLSISSGFKSSLAIILLRSKHNGENPYLYIVISPLNLCIMKATTISQAIIYLSILISPLFGCNNNSNSNHTNSRFEIIVSEDLEGEMYYIMDTATDSLIYDGGYNPITLDTVISGTYIFLRAHYKRRILCLVGNL